MPYTYEDVMVQAIMSFPWADHGITVPEGREWAEHLARHIRGHFL